MRFDFGTAAHVKSEDDRTSVRSTPRGHLLPVKAVDPSGEHGKILAEVDGIIPNSSLSRRDYLSLMGARASLAAAGLRMPLNVIKLPVRTDPSSVDIIGKLA
jgi:hypothetical protein